MIQAFFNTRSFISETEDLFLGERTVKLIPVHQVESELVTEVLGHLGEQETPWDSIVLSSPTSKLRQFIGSQYIEVEASVYNQGTKLLDFTTEINLNQIVAVSV